MILVSNAPSRIDVDRFRIIFVAHFDIRPRGGRRERGGLEVVRDAGVLGIHVSHARNLCSPALRPPLIHCSCYPGYIERQATQYDNVSMFSRLRVTGRNRDGRKFSGSDDSQKNCIGAHVDALVPRALGTAEVSAKAGPVGSLIRIKVMSFGQLPGCHHSIQRHAQSQPSTLMLEYLFHVRQPDVLNHES